MNFTEDQIVSLAPDASSLKAGKDLANTRKWVKREYSERALWGECQGSGKSPYQTQVDIHNIAFKCNCPSRKFPCKHGLGLLFLYIREKVAFSSNTEPTWVTDWLDKRADKAEKKTEKVDKPVDVEAQAKRAAARLKKVTDGVEDAQLWLSDLIRGGLLKVPEQAYEFWRNPSKRMVDAQASGLGNLMRELGDIDYYGEKWQHDLLHKITRIYLITEAFKNRENLPENMQEEIKNLIGFTQSKEELMTQEGVKDSWYVLSKHYESLDQITIEYNWLIGINTNQYALILQFFAFRQIPELSLLPGSTMHAELVYYKGISPLRALVKKQEGAPEVKLPAFHEGLNAAYQSFSKNLATNPFIEKSPFLLKNAHLILQDKTSFIQDQEGYCMPTNPDFTRDLNIMAITSGRSCDFFVLINEKHIQPMAIWLNQKYYSIHTQHNEK